MKCWWTRDEENFIFSLNCFAGALANVLCKVKGISLSTVWSVKVFINPAVRRDQAKGVARK